MDMVQSLLHILSSRANVDETSEKSGSTTPDKKNLRKDLDRTTNICDFHLASDEACDMLVNPIPFPMASGNTMRTQDNFFISDRGTYDDATENYTHVVPPFTPQEYTTQDQSKMESMDLCIPSIQKDFSPVDQSPFVNSTQENYEKIVRTPSFPLEQNSINSSPFEMPKINTHKNKEEYHLHPTDPSFLSFFSSSSEARLARVNSELPSLTINGNEVFFSDEEEKKEESEDGSNYSSSSTHPPCSTKKRKRDTVRKGKSKPSSDKRKKAGRPKRESKDGYPKRPLSGYNFFFKDERKRLLETMPKKKELVSMSTSHLYPRKGREQPHHKMSFQEMGKKIGINWKNAPKNVREKYTLMAKEEKKKYEEKVKEFKKLNPTQKTGSSDNNNKT